jgi:AraC-like DNA-binding protein
MTCQILTCDFSVAAPDLICARVSGYYFEPHLHSTFAVGALRGGQVTAVCRSARTTVREGDVFLFHPFEVHCGGNRAEPIDYHVLYPSVRLIRECLKLRSPGGDCPVFDRTHYQDSQSTRELLDALESSYCRSAAKLEVAFQRFLQSTKPISRTIPAIANSAVQRACDFISEHYTEPIRTEALASRAGLSVGHFIRLFRDITGLTPQSYLRQVRVAHARECICAGNELVDVAAENGFVDQAHMTHAFKSIYGFTPGHLSRNVGDDAESGTRSAHTSSTHPP